jgi:hypothetical protein
MQAGRLNQIYDKYADAVQFFCVYIQEAHPEDGWQLPINLEQEIVYNQPKTREERVGIAAACAIDLELRLPLLLDAMSNEVDSAYAALPERLYVIDAEGRIVYRGEPGPWGFDPDGWEQAIRAQLGSS